MGMTVMSDMDTVIAQDPDLIPGHVIGIGLINTGVATKR